MGLITRIGMLVKSNVNAIVTAAEDPEKILEQSINDMQEDLSRLRQAVAQSIAALNLQEKQYKESATQAQEWEKRAILAIQKGEENLAKEALSRKKTHADLAATLKAGLDQQSGQVELLKKNLIVIETKVSEAKTKKEMLKAQFLQAKTRENLNNMLSKVNTNSAAATFERMEERVRLQEALANASSELASDDLESQFIKLEAGSEIEDEYAALRAKVLSSSPAPQGTLPPSDAAKPSVRATITDEIEALRRQIGK
jgi:phage shock protein A